MAASIDFADTTDSSALQFQLVVPRKMSTRNNCRQQVRDCTGKKTLFMPWT